MPFKYLKLLYRGSQDGSTSQSFHDKCDNQGATITLYKNEKDFIFGGYNPISWNNEGGWIKDDNSFLFTLTNVHGIEPTKFPHIQGKDSVYNDNLPWGTSTLILIKLNYGRNLYLNSYFFRFY